MTEVLAVIPARGGSKGVPRKNLRPLLGRPLLVHTIVAAQEAARVTRVIVSTDDDEIAAVARAMGAEVPFLRAKALSGDEVHASAVVADVLARLEAAGEPLPRLVLMLLPTVPLRAARHIDAAIALFEESDAESVVAVCALGHYLAKLRRLEQGFLRPLVDGGLNTQRQGQEVLYYPNGGVYVAEARHFAKTRSFHLPGSVPYIMAQVHGVDIDRLEDFALAEVLKPLADATP
ncbi:MAG: acylneuraminate cytidylyltransferase family protein [Pseudomonadota bacterium]